MAKPIITDVDLLRENSDKEHRLVQKYQVQGTGLNVENIKPALERNYPKIWTEGKVNPYMTGDPTNATIASECSVSRDGKNENSFEAVITYAPRDEFNRRLTRKKDVKFQYPWDQDAEYSEDGQTVSVDYWGTDEKGQPFQYSNGQPVAMQREMPLVVINITRHRKATDLPSSPQLRRVYYQTTNSNTVNITIAGVSTVYNPRTLLATAFPIKLEKFKKIDPLTGKITTIPYFTESIQLIGRENTWATRIPDQGSFYRDTATGTGLIKKFINKKTKEREETDLLNGSGQQLLNLGESGGTQDYDADGTRKVNTAWTGNLLTPQGVKIDDTFTNSLGGKMVMLAFLTYEEKNFDALMLNLRL